MYVVVSEWHRGFRSSDYHFVIEEYKLVHISRYAISQNRKYKDMVEYIIDLNKLRGKRVIEISSSNSGIFCKAYMYPAEDLALEYSRRRVEDKSLSLINNFKLDYLSYYEKKFLQMEWRLYYIPMIEELHRLFAKLKSLNPESPYVSLTSLVNCQIKSHANYPLSFLIPYSENARRKSLETLTKHIHQLWIAMHILNNLAEHGLLKSIHLDFRQSSYYAIATFDCRNDLCSLWYEFDMNPHTMCRGVLWYSEASDTLKGFYKRVEKVLHRKRLRRAPLRPDIVILQGGASCDDLVKGFKVKMIIECKNRDYWYWAKDINNQVIPYKEIFHPDIMVLTSLKKVPNYAKKQLSRHGIVIVDEAYPGGKGEKELLQLIRTL